MKSISLFLFYISLLCCFFLISCSTDENNNSNENQASEEQNETQPEAIPVEIGLKEINSS